MRSFDTRLTTISPELIRLIGEIEQLKGQWVSSSKLSPKGLHRLKRSVLVTSTGASTRIEGSQLTDEQVDTLMRGLTIQKMANRDEQEVRGYFELLQNIFDAWESIPFSEGSIKHLHQELLKYVEKDNVHRGDYKHKENQVRLIDPKGKDHGTLFDTTPAFLTPKEMSELVEWTRKALADATFHPLLVIGHFVVAFLHIHPFEDGNGRLSRLLTNLLLLKSGYAFVPYVSQEKLIEDQKTGYYLALRASQQTFKTKREDATAWLTFFLKIVNMQAAQAIQRTAHEDIEAMLSTKQLAVWHYLQEQHEATPRAIAAATGIARPTVAQALNKLVALKRIARMGEGAATRYRVKDSTL